MPRSRSTVKGVFCLEGDWDGSLKRSSSVEPILQLLRNHDVYRVPYIFRDVGTKEELKYYLAKWTQKGYMRYPILYLAFHGEAGRIYAGDMRSEQGLVTLDFLEEHLAGRCKGRILHFGSCNTLDLNGHRINRFLRTTGALAICGYSAEVDWITSTAFELLVLAAMQDNAFTVAGARAMLGRIKRENAYLVRKLNFRMVIRKAADRT